MTTINYSIENTDEGDTWTGSLVWSSTIDTSTTKVLSANDPSTMSVTVNSVTTSSSVSRFLNFTSGLSGDGNSYSTWRSLDSATQFPETWTGYSFDMWSEDMYRYINSEPSSYYALGYTWDEIFNLGQVQLSDTKYTVFYSYEETRPIAFSKGGSINFTLGSA